MPLLTRSHSFFSTYLIPKADFHYHLVVSGLSGCDVASGFDHFKPLQVARTFGALGQPVLLWVMGVATSSL